MITTLQYLYGVLLPSGTLISELQDCTPKNNLKIISEMCAGDIYPQFIGGHGMSPSIDFRTPQIRSILSACGLIGYDASTGNTDLHYRYASLRSTRASTGLRVRCMNSLLHWSQISVSQNQTAAISCSVTPIYDGTNVPMTPAGGISVASMSELPQQYYTLGPVSINGSVVPGVQSWSLDLAPKVDTRESDGESYPSFVGISSHTPVLTVQTLSMDSWATVGGGGLALTSLEFYLRLKSLDSVGCVANATASHIKFSATSGSVFVEQGSGGENEPAACTLKIHLRRASTTDSHPLTLSLASAIA